MDGYSTQGPAKISGIAYTTGRIITLIILTVIVLTAILMVGFNGVMLSIALPTIANQFNAGIDLLQWVITGYFLAMTGLFIVFGKVSEYTGKKKLFVAGLAVFVLGALASGFTTSIELIAFSIPQGVGASMILGVGSAILFDAYPSRWRGVAMGCIAGVSGIGALLGPLVGGLIVGSFGWQYAFFVNVPIGILLVCALMFLKIPEATPDRTKSTYLSIYGNKKFMLPVVSLFLFTMAISIWNMFGVFYFQLAMNYSPIQIGMLLMLMPAAMVVMALLSGLLYSIYPWKYAAASGGLIAAVALLLLGYAFLAMNSGLIRIALLLTGIGYGLFISPNNTEIMEGLPMEKTAIAAGVLFTVKNLTSFIIAMSIGTLLTISLGNVGYHGSIFSAGAPQISGMIGMAMIAAGALCAVAMVTSTFRNI